MIEGEVKIGTQMIKVDTAVIEVIEICAIDRDLAHRPEVRRRNITSIESQLTL